MSYPFTLDGYKDLIQSILDTGYTLQSFHGADPDQQHLILRHDVDQSIPIAREMADLEASEGWSSTWFVLIRTNMYNPFSMENTRALKAMADAGHEIGLHLDASLYEDTRTLQEGAEVELRILEDVVGKNVGIVSFHRPVKALIGSSNTMAGRPHTYMPRYTQAMGYCSDSRGEWRYGSPTQNEAFQQRRALQLLTHAIWWVGPEGRTPRGRLVDFLSDSQRVIDQELKLNNAVWNIKK